MDSGAEPKEEKEMDPRTYELGYLLVPTIGEGDILTEAGRLKGVIESCGGIIISDENPKETALAYPIDRRVEGKKKIFTSAYFGWAKFQGEPESVAALKKSMEADESVIRFLIIKTVKENTLMQKRPFSGITAKKNDVSKTKTEKPKEITPVSEAELDKTIEELVIY
jgi:ribosomal protein S6